MSLELQAVMEPVSASFCCKKTFPAFFFNHLPVTYASLHHCSRWRDEIPKLKIEELVGAEHRAILANRLFFK
jgi:hypothetical protein